MKVIFATIHLEESTRAVPLAAACLKAEIVGHDVILMDFSLDHSAEEIAAKIKDETPDVLGFPVYLWNRSLVLETIGLLKKSCPDLPVIAGGAETTAAPEAFLRDSGIICVNQGEGEETINPLLDALEKGEEIPRLPGLWSSASAPSAPGFCRRLDELASPILSGALELKTKGGLLWELSRGCPFSCEFCFESKGSSRVRYFPEKRIYDELEKIGEAGISQVFVLDPTFNVKKDRTLKILDKIAETAPGCYFYFEARTEFLDEETAEAFSRIPCTLQIGLQSSSPEVLKHIGRQLDPEDFAEKTGLLSEAGVSFGLDLIYGLPGDSLEGFRESLDYALALEPNHLDLFPLAVLPGTLLYDKKESLEMICDDKDPYLIRELPGFSADDLKEAAALSRACDSLYNRERGISWMSRACYDLEIPPSAVIDEWISFTAEGSDEEEGSALLTAFLAYLYRNQPGLIPVMKDLVSYMDLLDELDGEESAESPTELINLEENSRFILHPSARLKTLNLPPYILASGFPGESAVLAEEAGSYGTVFWLRDGEFCFESTEAWDQAVWTALKTGTSWKELKNLANADEEELREFLISGLLEAFLVFD